MQAFKQFPDLDDETFFIDFVDEQFRLGWPRVSAVSGAKIATDREAIKVAFQTYAANLAGYKLALPSKNPDHYKRAGSFLHSLYKASASKKIITLEWDEEIERLKDHDGVGVSYNDAEYWNNFTRWYDDLCNEMMAFDLAFRCCEMHEQGEWQYNKDFMDNMCFYMAENNNINVGSFVMILKAYFTPNEG